MFFDYAKGFAHDTKDLTIIWEIELVMSSVFIDAIETEQSLSIDALEAETIKLLAGRNVSSELQDELRREFRLVLKKNAGLIEGLILKISNRNQGLGFRAQFNPDKKELMSALSRDCGFSEHVKAQKQLAN